MINYKFPCLDLSEISILLDSQSNSFIRKQSQNEKPCHINLWVYRLKLDPEIDFSFKDCYNFNINYNVKTRKKLTTLVGSNLEIENVVLCAHQRLYPCPTEIDTAIKKMPEKSVSFAQFEFIPTNVDGKNWPTIHLTVTGEITY